MKSETVILVVVIAIAALGGFMLLNQENAAKSQLAADQLQIGTLQANINNLQSQVSQQKQQQTSSGGGFVSGILSAFGL